MKLGFTGTRYGMSDKQKNQLRTFLRQYVITEFHHGGCVGADTEAAELVKLFSPATIIEHPGQPGTYLKRNREIVDQTELLVAAPLTDTPQDRGGTWYTIKYAQKQGKEVVFLNRS